MNYHLGIDLGGTSIKFVTVTSDGTILDRGQQSFDANKRLDFAHKIQEVVAALKSELNAPAASIGLSAPGLAARDGLSIAHMPGRLNGLEGLNWTTFLQSPKPVPVLNDAHAALLGEVWLGAAKGFTDAILLTLGTGVGGAILSDGKLLRGPMGRAGHLGHASLDPDGPPDIANAPGSLEDAIGNCTIELRSQGRFTTTHDLIKAHESGDAVATAIWLKSAKALAAAIASFINILDCQAVIIGGGIARCGDTLFVPLNSYLAGMEWRPAGRMAEILPATLGEYAGAIGAAKQGMDGA